MSTNIATNIRLPEEVLKALKYKAIEERKSVNRLILEAVEASLIPAALNEKPPRDPFEDIIGIAKTGIMDGSEKHDRYLYGEKE